MTALSSRYSRLLLVGALALTAGATRATALPVYSEDFESGVHGSAFGNFYANSTGIDVNGTIDMGHDSSGYDNDEFSYYDLPVLDLTLSSGTRLQFDFNISTEETFDGFNVVAGDGMGAWELLPVISGVTYAPVAALGDVGASGVQSGTAIFDLSNFDGVLGAVVRIQFASDSSITAPGVAIDNLKITPEPSTAILFAGGLVGLAATRRRRMLK